MERIVIVINKNWEADPVFAALFNEEFRAKLPAEAQELWKGIQLTSLNYPFKGHSDPPEKRAPQAIYTKDNFQVEIWCLTNVMIPPPAGSNDGFFYSRSGQKAKDMPMILNYSTDPISLVVAFGTAGVPSEITKNGGLVIGSGIFPYDSGKLKAPDPFYAHPLLGTLVRSTVGKDFFDQLNLANSSIGMKLYFESAMLTPPQNPSNSFQLLADENIVAISDINISDYKDLAECDKLAAASFKNLKGTLGDSGKKLTPYSIETTHAIIRLELKCDNFVFISAITDRSNYFDIEVTPKALAQNFSASFNGGVFLSWFIPFSIDYFHKESQRPAVTLH